MANDKDDDKQPSDAMNTSSVTAPATEELEEYTVIETDDHGKPLAGEEGAAPAGEPEPEEDDEDEERVALEDAETRKEQKRLRREKRKAAIERDRLQIAELRRENNVLAERLHGLEVNQGRQNANQLEDRLRQVNGQLSQTEAILQDALGKSQPQRVVEAMRVRDALVEQRRNLEQAVDSVKRARPAPASQGEQPLDTATRAHVTRFQSGHSWYDPAGRDTDSRVTLALDQAISEEGYDASTQAYWDELERRIAQYLPHRAQRARAPAPQAGEQGQRRGPPISGGGVDSRGVKPRNPVYVSPERKAAMIEAGVWDDKKKRQRYLKSYADWDRQQAEQNQQGARQ